MKKYLIKVNGNEYEVEVKEVRHEAVATNIASTVAPAATAAPAPVKAAPVAPSAPAAPKMDTTVPQGATKINAPMPGTILKINVNQGDAVKKGQVLLILEAMKMENEITAPADGTVATINVSKGSSVSVGDVMISLA